MKNFLQFILVALCVAFLLMSACGGVYLVGSLGQKDDYGIAPVAGFCFVLFGLLSGLMFWFYKRVSRNKEPKDPA